MTIDRVPEHSPPLILRSRVAASRRMAANSEPDQLTVRDAHKGALLTMRDGETP